MRGIRSRRSTILGGLGVFLAGLAVVAGASWWSARADAQAGNGSRFSSLVQSADGQPLGTWTFTQAGDKVRVEVEVSGLPPGFHGFHIHSAGVCEPATGFMSAGGHFSPAGGVHAGHAGDMPSLYVNADGTGTLGFTTDRFQVADLHDADGSAVIVHADPDNFAHFPARYGVAPDTMTLSTGDAGARIACGVVK